MKRKWLIQKEAGSITKYFDIDKLEDV